MFKIFELAICLKEVCPVIFLVFVVGMKDAFTA